MSNKSRRSPCYVFLIGAAKCGTTALSELLETHPDVCVSLPKEPDYFTNEGIIRGEQWYEERFSHLPDASVRLDASVSYSAGWGDGSGNIAARIAAFSPDARLIYILRDPVERTRAAYWHARRSGYEKKSLIDAVSDARVDHVQASLYHARMTDYLVHFNQSSMMLLTQERLLNEPQEVLDEIFAWLGLNSISIVPTRANRTYQLSPLGRLLGRLLPLPLLQKMARLVRHRLPERLRAFLMAMYSKPIPTLSKDEEKHLMQLFQNDTQLLLNEYGLDIRTSPCWKESKNMEIMQNLKGIT